MAEIDIIRLREIALRLAKNVEGLKKRYFLGQIEIGKEPRIKVLRGFRGVGKTTALIQLMGSMERSAYFSMDNPNIQEFDLYSIGSSLIKSGYTTLFIDEIHHYPDWKLHTKALYDEFPKSNLILSGSAPLAFEPERRYEIIEVEQLSFREFLTLQDKKIDLTESWTNLDQTLKLLASYSWVYEYYDKYLAGGAFPLFFLYGEKTLPSIYNAIVKSIREDAPFFAKVDGETIRAMERILVFLGSAVLGEFSSNSLSRTLGVSKHKTYEAVFLLEAMRILRIVRPFGRGAKLVRGEPKLMFHHPCLRAAICDALGVAPDKGALREELAVFSFLGRGWNVYTIKGRKRNPDYLIEKKGQRIVVEIGGDNKSATQLKGFSEKTLVIGERQLIVLSLF